jgi:hypothetical protein
MNVFWKDGFESGKGGIYYRDVELINFIKKVEDSQGEVVAIRIEDGNLELLIEVEALGEVRKKC